MAFLAAAFSALAVFAIVVLVLRPRRLPAPVEERLDRLERGDVLGRDEFMELPFSARVASPLGRKFRSVGLALLPQRIVRAVDHYLMLAGRPVTVSRFFLFQFLMVGVSAFLLFAILRGDVSGLFLLGMLVACVVPIAVPGYWLRIRVGMRRRAIVRALPDAVDLMVTTVEAGMGIDGALSAVGNETKGPLGDELRLAVRETTLGRSRREALLRMVERTHVPELTSFVQAIVQAEQTGIPIGQVLRIQAGEMRLKRRQAAEAMAQKAPVKMILVMIVLVLPAMLMFVMVPAFMRMRDAI